MRSISLLAMILPLAACNTQDIGDSIGRRAAATVVKPVVQIDLTGPQADLATDCIVKNATAAEVQALARDIGVSAGTLTTATIRGIALRPETQSCFAANGVPPVR